ncbi:MAG TPA: aldehyde dehydrogenase family protein [Nocardioidaceae bacterium]|nr:aldehyde dehydrogenase family protein [Nocardioidaceae bacterium]
MTDLTTPPLELEADAIVDRLTRGETAWARTSLFQRRALLEEFRTLVDDNADEWVRIAAEIKQIPAGSPLLGEEWVSGPWAVLAYVEALIGTLQRLEQGVDVLKGFKARSVMGGRLGIDVLPHSTYDRLLLTGYSAQVWMKPGLTADDVRRSAGLGQRQPHETNGVCLVLGAGNITSIAPLDVLYVLFADNRVAALKLNPVADRLEPVFRRIFEPFTSLGAVEVLTGGVALGSALAYHDGIAAVHMTGSENTHDAIVWGPGEQGAANKAAGTPLLDKPMSSELGGVSPVIVVPGQWSHSDLRHQARHIATLRLHNTGSNCVAAQVVVVSSDWDQKDAFLGELRAALAEAPARPSWYPGCSTRVAGARSAHPQAEAVGGTADRTLITGLCFGDPHETAFHEEYFGPVLGVAELPGMAAEFLCSAVTAANQELRGTLGANIVIHPRTRRHLGKTFEEQVERLRYGTIGINVWTALGYLTPHATWGAFPGHSLDDIQSGHGVVHNALLLDGAERTVVSGPFRPLVKPPWFVQNRTADRTGRLLASFAARPRWSALPGIFASALRG